MIRLYRIPLSTNVERVALALAHKGLETESVVVDPKDRSEIRRVSGQDLVPVLDHDGKIVADSTLILEYLETRFPEKPLYPRERARRAEMEIFVDWFNRVWKRPPNEIYREMTAPTPDAALIEKLGREMTSALDRFESLLAGREFLMGEFSAADCAAFPFVKYAIFMEPDDPYLFHKILRDYQRLGDTHPLTEAWIRRVNEFPRV